MNTESVLSEIFFANERHNMIRFDPIEHRYFYNTGKMDRDVEFYGVTSLLKEFEEHKDWNAIATGSAMKLRKQGVKITPGELRAQWKAKGDEARDRGNEIHESIEVYIQENEIIFADTHIVDAFKIAMASEGLTPIGAEIVLFDDRINRASPVDILTLDYDGKFAVVDTKTMKDGLTYEGYKGEMMKYPLHHVPNSKYHKYCLQVNIYKIWLRDIYGCDVADTHYIYHINDEVSEMIPVIDMEDEVNKIYNYIMELK